MEESLCQPDAFLSHRRPEQAQGQQGGVREGRKEERKKENVAESPVATHQRGGCHKGWHIRRCVGGKASPMLGAMTHACGRTPGRHRLGMGGRGRGEITLQAARRIAVPLKRLGPPLPERADLGITTEPRIDRLRICSMLLLIRNGIADERRVQHRLWQAAVRAQPVGGIDHSGQRTAEGD